MKKLLAVVAVVVSAGVFWIASRWAYDPPGWIVDLKAEAIMREWRSQGAPPADGEQIETILPPAEPAPSSGDAIHMPAKSEDGFGCSHGYVIKADQPGLAGGLREALIRDDRGAVRMALFSGAVDPVGLTPLQAERLRRERLTMSLFSAGEKGDARDLRRLLRGGADPNAAFEYHAEQTVTALARAAQCNQAEAVGILVLAGASVDAGQRRRDGPRTYSRETPLIVASRSGAGDAIRRLLELGADVNAHEWVEDRRGGGGLGETPLIAARDAWVTERLINAGGDPNRASFEGRTPLMAAAEANDPARVVVLLRAGANPRARDRGGRTAGDFADGHHADLIRRLLQVGNGIEAADAAGRTFLSEAAAAGDRETVRILIDGGVDPSAKAPGGLPLWEWSFLGGQPAVAKLLHQRSYPPESFLTMAEALRQPLGSRREAPCGGSYLMDSGRRLAPASDSFRRFLARRGFEPFLLDGMVCIWRAGPLVGETGRRYQLYLHQVEWGASTKHETSRLLLVEGDRITSVDRLEDTTFHVQGPDLVFDRGAPDARRVRFGAKGPQGFVLVDGGEMYFGDSPLKSQGAPHQ